MPLVRWTVRWGDAVIATGTGRVPPEYGLPQPRVTHGDRAVVRSGNLTAEAVRIPTPPRAPRWGMPDVHFLKIATLCLMAFAAALVLVRERVQELKLAAVERPEEADIFHPLPARWVGHTGFTRSAKHADVIPARDLARIKRFAGKARALEEREAAKKTLAAFGVLGVLSSSSDVRIFGRDLDRVEGGVFGGLTGSGASAVGGFGSARGPGLGGLGAGGGGIGTLGTVIEGRGEGGGGGLGLGGLGTRGSGYGGGGVAADLGSLGGAVGVYTDGAENRRVLARARHEMAECLRDLHRGLTTELELFDDGRVKSVTMDAPASVQRCVSRALEPLHFPAGAEHLTARWVFRT